MPKGRYVAFIRNASGRIVYHTPEFKTRAEALARAIKRYPKEALIYTVRDQTEDVKAHPRKMVATYSKIFGNPPRSASSRSSSARTRTSTDASVRSPTRTSTSTHAYTRGNITVTGGAGAGATTVNLPGAKKNAKPKKNIARKAPKRKARANSKSTRAKRKSVRGNPGRAGKWVIRAQTAAGVSKRPFYWTGTSFSDQPTKRKKFASIATARERAALILPQLPLEIRAIAIEPA